MTDHAATTLIGLQSALRAGLPGHDAFRELSGYQRPNIDAVLRRSPPPRESGVLILLHPVAGELHTLLIERPEYDGVHSGQIAFPGGHRESFDPDIEHTALREFTEETGAPHADLRVLGTLTRVYIPPSNALVTPVLAYTDAVGAFAPDAREVAKLIHVPIKELTRNDILKRTELHIRMLGRTVEVPYWDVQGHVVWGATAMMIAELRELLHRLG